MAINNQKTILIAPLDWGLGHATRCIPIIKELQNQNCVVIIAAEKATLKLIIQAFPNIQTIFLRGYRVHYSRSKFLFSINLLIQFPKLAISLYKEHYWLKKVVKNYKVDAVVSDNRFGLFHHLVPCVYITHQLNIKTGFHITDKIVKNFHDWIIKKFTYCWVPDFENVQNSLAGLLSHGASPPHNITYIGCLSRFQNKCQANKQYNIVAVLSGPEPQRTILESLLLAQLQQLEGKSLLVRGLPENIQPVAHLATQRVDVKNHLSSEELNKVMLQADWILARCGYTTVMDLVKIRQKAILIPTPGQTEQEYLADFLYKKKYFYTTTQQNFDLVTAINAAKLSSFCPPDVDMNSYKRVITDFVQSL